KALALTCFSGATELTILPLIDRNSSWAFIFHCTLIPLFFSSFAYLFLVFPRERTIRIRHTTIPTWVVPLTSIPIGLAWVLTVFFAPDRYGTFQAIAYPYLIACLLLGIGSLIVGWFSTEDARTRVQIRLVVFGSFLSVAPMFLLSILPEALAGTDVVSTKFSPIPLVLIPLSFAYAILRYQVMDLQLYVKRGIVYSLLALCVTGTYALILVIGTSFVQHRAGTGDVAVLAVSGTIIAIIFQRLRDWLQQRIDRLFDRNYYDYRRQLLEFSQRMTEILVEKDLGKLTAELVSQTMGPTHVRLYSFDSSSEIYRCTSSVGVPVPGDWEEISSLHPFIIELAESGLVLQKFNAQPDSPALTIQLRKQDDIIGLLVLGPKKADLPYSSEDISLLRTVANQLAVAADNARLYERTRELYFSSIRTLAATVDAKDPYTHGHSERVSSYARKVATQLNLSHDDIEAIELAGLLHDIGKIGIPDAILQKPGRLDPDERDLIMEHAALGAKIISENSSLMPLAPLVRHHHEWFNGNGYPDGLVGLDIPLGAAIISVADTYDTMTTDRPYRAAPGNEKALAELARCSGTQFRPDVVAAFLKVRGATPVEEPAAAALPVTYTVTGRISSVDSRAMRIVYRVVQMIGDVTELNNFIGGVIELIRRELGTGTVDIYLTDLGSGDLISQSRTLDDFPMQEIWVTKGTGLVGWTAEHCTPARVEDTRYDARGSAGRSPKTRSHLAVPLVIDDKAIGVIDVQSRRTGSFTIDDEMLLVIVAQQLAQVIEVAQLHDQLKKNAILDGLTGVANHRYFYQRLEEELARSERSGDPVSLLLIDVDGLKLLNDTHGHVVGDAALRTIASVLERESRSIDVVARYGGDEFAVILPGVDANGARTCADRIAATIDGATFNLNGETIALPTVSWGRSTLGVDGDRAVSLVASADARMYRDKFNIPETSIQSVVSSSAG
ncbi:MAG TPA: diguanylate cyclase, partial [Nitrolancea sp.]|nr:diguanylate cyclase [Nitrolancea sp.]